MLPSGATAGRSRLDPGYGRQGLREVALCCTRRFRNAHRTVCRNVLYRFHPWCGRDVFVHEVIEKAGGGAFRCTLDGSEVERWLEIPAWMFDRAACASDGFFSIDPFVRLEALEALSALLDHVLKADATSSNVRLRSAGGISHDQNRGDSHGAKDDGASDRQSEQAVTCSAADGFVRKPSSDRLAQLARFAEGSKRSADRSDGAAHPEHARTTTAPTMVGADHDC
jgi:hypothetical protein